MNLLLVTLAARFDSEGANFWRVKLRDRGHVFVLRVFGLEGTQMPDDYSHNLEQILFCTEYRRWPKKFIELSMRNMERLRLLIPQLDYPCSLLLWKAVLRFRACELTYDLRSFDPDLIDLRWVPQTGSLLSRLPREMQNVVVLSKDKRPPTVSPNDSWRIYDPGLKVTIVLPVYNGARYVRESIESCLNQTHRNLQLIIVDDCSNDETPEIIEEYAKRDDRILSIRNKTNLHLPGALNVGFRASTGQLLSWTSHDNFYAPAAIETLVKQLCSFPDVGLVYAAFRHIDDGGRLDPRIVYLPPPWFLPSVNCVGPCFLYRRTVYEATGDYNEKAEYQEDYEYWLRVSQRFKLMRLHLPLYYYRRNPESMTAKRRKHPEIVGPLDLP